MTLAPLMATMQISATAAIAEAIPRERVAEAVDQCGRAVSSGSKIGLTCPASTPDSSPAVSAAGGAIARLLHRVGDRLELVVERP